MRKSNLKVLPSKEGSVYIFKVRNKNIFKIGRTVNVKDRLRTVQTNSPLKIDYVYHVDVSDTCEVESALHRRYQENWLIGEWFTLSDGEVKDCVFLMRLMVQELTQTDEDIESLDLIISKQNDGEKLNQIRRLWAEGETKLTVIIPAVYGVKIGSHAYRKAREDFRKLTGE